MNITLRKANAVQTSINDILKGMSFTTEVSINEFQVPNFEISMVESEFAKNLARRDALLTALYEIRKLVSKGNDVSTISDHLADVALLDKHIQFFTELAGKSVKESTAVISGKLEKIRSGKEDARRNIYGIGSDTVTTSVLEKSDIDGFKAMVSQFKKQKQTVQDQILEMNVRTELPVSDATIKTLQDENIL
jgi:hypothetical protein